MNKCPECLKDLPDELTVCNNCGAAIKTQKKTKDKKSKKKGLIISISLIMVLILVASAVFAIISKIGKICHMELRLCVKSYHKIYFMTQRFILSSFFRHIFQFLIMFSHFNGNL